MLKIPYGISNFERIRTQGYVYVDKTHFIEKVEFATFPIHLRPRRFGKSLHASMLESYYDVASSDKFDELFKGLYIHEFPTKNRNNYYILRFNFSGIATKDADTVLDGFRAKIKEGIKSFIKKYELEINCDLSGSPAKILNSLLTSFNDLKLNHKIYLLIDEYDHFTNAVLNNGLEDFMTLVTRGGMVRSFYEIIKESTEAGIIENFFITGVMSVSLDSMTSGFNIATKITTDEQFTDMMGFTSDEVKKLLSTPFMNSKKEEIILTVNEQDEVYEILRQNYNGYRFSEDSEIKVFNSTLIMYYMKNYVENKNHPKQIVDANLNQKGATIRTLVDLKNAEANYNIIEEIVNTKSTQANLSTFINVDEKFDEDDFITLLFNIGLLTIKDAGARTKFEIPNKVIESVYLQYLTDLASKKLGYEQSVRKVGNAIDSLAENGTIHDITNLVSGFFKQTSNSNTRKFDEKYIKLAYKMLLSSTNQFITYDEFPANQGFADLVILKSPASYSQFEYLIELKYLKISETTPASIESGFKDAVNQIHSYMEDERLSIRPNLKRFVVIFSGFEVVKIEEIN